MNPEASDATSLKSQVILRLFVAGEEPNSKQAERNLRVFCEKHLPDALIERVDVYKDYQLAIQNNVWVTPALMVVEPKSDRMLVGTLSDAGELENILGVV